MCCCCCCASLLYFTHLIFRVMFASTQRKTVLQSSRQSHQQTMKLRSKNSQVNSKKMLIQLLQTLFGKVGQNTPRTCILSQGWGRWNYLSSNPPPPPPYLFLLVLQNSWRQCWRGSLKERRKLSPEAKLFIESIWLSHAFCLLFATLNQFLLRVTTTVLLRWILIIFWRWVV